MDVVIALTASQSDAGDNVLHKDKAPPIPPACLQSSSGGKVRVSYLSNRSNALALDDEARSGQKLVLEVSNEILVPSKAVEGNAVRSFNIRIKDVIHED